jgi:hypothetical protein
MDRFLYHGTKAALLDQIKQHGIAPRSVTNANNKWSEEAHSNQDIVYLTNGYPWHFAFEATKTFGPGLVLEIDTERLDASLFRADEDYIAQVVAMRDGAGDDYFLEIPMEQIKEMSGDEYLAAIHDKARENAKKFPELVNSSLTNLGTVAYYGTIPWSAVTRYVIIDWRKVWLAYTRRVCQADRADPKYRSLTCVASYQLCGPSHQEFTRWMFGDRVNETEMLHRFYFPNRRTSKQQKKMEQELRTIRREMERCREGLRIFVANSSAKTEAA